jgi:nitrate reductase gamma subunit
MTKSLANMTFLLTVAAYIVALFFYVSLSLRLVRWALREGQRTPWRRRSPASVVLAALDIVFLRRLLALNPVLWIGEWVFHASLVLVFLSHLRYFFHPAPEIFTLAVPLGKVAAYTMPASLAYILLFRLSAMLFAKGYFTSMYNMFLTTVILLTSVTGDLLRHVYRADLIGVKNYMIKFFAFKPAEFPDSAMFAAHFALALLVVAAVPTHIFAAPLSLLDAGVRQEGIRTLMRDDEE